ncbi:hypothetical protein LINPERHAP1_LOCUS399, partial [Linum perenne]
MFSRDLFSFRFLPNCLGLSYRLMFFFYDYNFYLKALQVLTNFIFKFP